MSWMGIILTFALVDNVILSRLLGVYPAACVPSHMRAARIIGLFTALLMFLSCVAGWAVDGLVLVPLGFGFLRTPVFLFIVVGFAYLLRTLAQGAAPGLLKAAGVSLPEIAVNCATLGIVLISTREGFGAVQSLVVGLSAGLGYFIVTALLTAIRERLEIEQTPEALRGFPLHVISAGLLAYAFMAFDRAFLLRLLGS
jgi:Na+-translocating ferredoxin:NAD+ oxidoreductase subunit A